MTKIEEREEKVKLAIEIAIKVSLLGLVILLTYLIAKPFIAIIVWGIIIAVALSPLINSLEKRFGHRKKVIIGFTVTVIAALLIPTYMLSGYMIDSSTTLVSEIRDGNVTIPPPTEKVKEWPLIGEKAYAFWDSASHNLRTTLAPFKEKIREMAGSIFSALGSGLGTIFMFIGSFIIAAVFLISSEGSVNFYRTLMRRIVGDSGDEWAELSALTVRSVVTGVIGVAVIQATLALIGLGLMGVPFSVVLAIGIMFLTIIQVPALLIIGPVIAYVFSQGNGTAEIVFAIYMLIVGASDGVLKPMLMGRGVDIPMLVILIGAIGGMILMGMIGLFIGAVIFALAYKLFGLWIADVKEEAASEEA
ncbi:AI-2E family transporter [Sulfurovum sp.]|uniref:AI-2E family transporter n=1 Tax=Sulfurovum sp. TaxID=1969726 RepID=UPI00286814AC|nr:AI-2E family transporter [Sulfurovum sp.]